MRGDVLPLDPVVGWMTVDHDAASTLPYIVHRHLLPPDPRHVHSIPHAGLRQLTVTTVWPNAQRASLTANLPFNPSLLASSCRGTIGLSSPG